MTISQLQQIIGYKTNDTVDVLDTNIKYRYDSTTNSGIKPFDNITLGSWIFYSYINKIDLSQSGTTNTLTIIPTSGISVILSGATTGSSGLMIGGDKIKLNSLYNFTGGTSNQISNSSSIVTGNTVTNAIDNLYNQITGKTSSTNLSQSGTTTTLTILSDTGNDVVLSGATTGSSGLLIASDKIKLNTIPLSPVAEIPSGNVDGNNTIFTLSTQPSTNLGVVVILDGFVQYNTIDYNVVGQTITFTIAPASGSTIFTNYTQSTISQTGLTSTDVNSLIDNRLGNISYGSTIIRNNSTASGTTITDALTNLDNTRAVTRKLSTTAWVATDTTLSLTYDVDKDFATGTPVSIVTTVTITLIPPPATLSSIYWFKFKAGSGWGFIWPVGYTSAIGNDTIISGTIYEITFHQGIYKIKSVA